MVQEACSYIEKTPNMEVKLKLIDTLRTVTAGKVCCYMSQCGMEGGGGGIEWDGRGGGSVEWVGRGRYRVGWKGRGRYGGGRGRYRVGGLRMTVVSNKADND